MVDGWAATNGAGRIFQVAFEVALLSAHRRPHLIASPGILIPDCPLPTAHVDAAHSCLEHAIRRPAGDGIGVARKQIFAWNSLWHRIDIASTSRHPWPGPNR